MIEEGILTTCSNHLAIATSRLLAVNKLFTRNLLEQCLFVMAKLGFKFKPKNRNREAVANVVIVKPSIDDENPTNKRSTSKECYCSAAIL